MPWTIAMLHGVGGGATGCSRWSGRFRVPAVPPHCRGRGSVPMDGRHWRTARGRAPDTVADAHPDRSVPVVGGGVSARTLPQAVGNGLTARTVGSVAVAGQPGRRPAAGRSVSPANADPGEHDVDQLIQKVGRHRVAAQQPPNPQRAHQ